MTGMDTAGTALRPGDAVAGIRDHLGLVAGPTGGSARVGPRGLVWGPVRDLSRCDQGHGQPAYAADPRHLRRIPDGKDR
ncbi:MAG TPA: hypothetical protein VII06_43170 [Chloroflexota bacterium]|jgi:hypothetical protein